MCNQSPKCFEEQSQLNVERAASGTMKKQPRILPLPLRKLRVKVRMTTYCFHLHVGDATVTLSPRQALGARV
jgi:hypothetical protein